MALPTRNTMRGVLLAGVLAALLSGCTGAGNERASGIADGAGSAPSPGLAEGDARAEGEVGTEPARGVPDGRDLADAASPPAFAENRKLARSASLTLRSDDVAGDAAKVRSVAARAGGYTGSELAGDDTATLTITVPGDKLDQVLDQLAGIGEVTGRELHVSDVTEEVADVDSRLATQRASVARVRALLARARTISEIVAIEGELTSRQSELEALLARQKALAGMVAMAPVTVSISSRDADDEPPAGFLGGFERGWAAFVGATGVLLTVLGASLPFVLVLGVPAALVLWWLVRRRRMAASVEAGPAVGEPAREAAD